MLKNNKGFTIIEVLIVLAIAGVIMLVVFLAVPALQRNSRNTQRVNDASLLSTSISECLNNRNGLVGSCDTIAELSAISLDQAKLRQITSLPTAAFPTSTTANLGSPADVSSALVAFGRGCSADGADDVAGSARQFIVMYKVETPGTAVDRCLES